MITSADIREKQFQKSGMSGYKQSDVNAYMDQLASTLDALSAEKAALERQVQEYASKVDEYKKNEGVLQTALLNAQRLANEITVGAKNDAEGIVSEAKQTAEQLLSRAKAEASALMQEAESKSCEMLERSQEAADKLTDNTRREAALMIESAKQTADDEIGRAREAVSRQKDLLSALKLEVASFKTDIMAKYDAQMLLIKSLPDEIDAETAKQVGDVLADAIKSEPSGDMPDERNQVEKIIDEMALDIEYAEETVEEVKSRVAAIDADSSAESERETPLEDMPEGSVEAPAEEPVEEPAEAEPVADEQPPRRGGFTIRLPEDDEDDTLPHTDGGTLNFGGQLSFGGSEAESDK